MMNCKKYTLLLDHFTSLRVYSTKAKKENCRCRYRDIPTVPIYFFGLASFSYFK
jgi:hypothetical protein